MELLTGSEKFTLHGESIEMTVLDYWAWSCSDLYDNTMRGVMAEFLVSSSFNKGNYPPPRLANANKLATL